MQSHTVINFLRQTSYKKFNFMQGIYFSILCSSWHGKTKNLEAYQKLQISDVIYAETFFLIQGREGVTGWG